MSQEEVENKLEPLTADGPVGRRGRPPAKGNLAKMAKRNRRDAQKRDPRTGLNESQERFAGFVAQGMRLVEAAKLAGYGEDHGNASKLASRPKVKQRIVELRNRIVAARERSETIAEQAQVAKYEENDITVAWLIEEAKKNMRYARDEGKYKDSNDSIKLIAQLSGYIRGGKEGDDDNDKGKNPNANPQSPINIQVLNQLTERLGRGTGNSPTEGVETTTVISGNLDRALPDVGASEPIDGDYSVVGEDPKPVRVPAVPRGSE